MKRNAITSTTTTGRNGHSVAATNVASNGSSVAAANVASNGSSVAAANVASNGSSVAATTTSRVSELAAMFERMSKDAADASTELRRLVPAESGSPPRPTDEPVKDQEPEQPEDQEPEQPEDQKPDPQSLDFPLQVSEKLEGEYKNLAHWPREARNQLETDLILWEELFTGQPKKKQKEIRKSLLLALKHAATAAAPAAPVPTTKAAPAAAKAAVPKEEFPTLPKPATAPTTRPPSFAQMAARPQTEEAQRLAAQQAADAKKEKEYAERARGAARGGHARGRVDVWSAAAQGAASKSLYRQQLKEVVSQESMEAGKYLASLQAHVENALPHLAKMLVNAILAHAGYDQRGVSYLKTNIRWWDEDAAAEENKRRRHRWGESAKLVQAHSEEHLPTYVAILDITEEMFETFSGEYGLDLSALIAHTPTCAELTLLMSERYASCQDRVFHTRFHVSLPERGQIKCTVVKLSDRHAREYKSEVEAKAAAKAAALQAADDAENARKAAQAARAEANGGWGSAA